MSDPVVLMAFRGDGEGYGGEGWRDRSFTFVYDHLDPHFEVVVADSGDEPFNVSKSYNLAARLAGDWDTAILHPPDECVPIESIRRAADLNHPGMAHAFDRGVWLNGEGSDRFRETGQVDESAVNRRKTRSTSGPRVVTREAWETVGGMNEHLSGWGSEDTILAHCFKVLVGPPAWVDGLKVHLWHPRNQGSFYAHKRENRALRAKIERITSPAKLRDYLGL